MINPFNLCHRREWFFGDTGESVLRSSFPTGGVGAGMHDGCNNGQVSFHARRVGLEGVWPLEHREGFQTVKTEGGEVSPESRLSPMMFRHEVRLGGTTVRGVALRAPHRW